MNYIFGRYISPQELYAAHFPSAQETLLAPQASDAACQTASQAITVTVDSDAPTVNFTSPDSGSYVDSSDFQVVGGEAFDPTSFIYAVEVSVDSGAFQPASGAESWAYTWDKRGLGSGTHTLAARTVDAVGHISSSASIRPNRLHPPTASWDH
jgi:hypothetical protein